MLTNNAAELSFVFLERSYASKIGPISATYSSRDTCWSGCAFYNKGCYAEQGNVALVHMERRKDIPRLTWDQLLDKISTIPAGDVWRHNVGGDLPGVGAQIDPVMMNGLIEANAGKRAFKDARRGYKRGFTFTHKPVLGSSSIAAQNRNLIARAVDNGFMISLSGDSLSHADKLADLNIAPVVTVLPRTYMRQTSRMSSTKFVESVGEWKERIAQLPRKTPQGRKIAICPATYLDGVTCSKCKACSLDRDAIIGFPAHGARYNTVDQVIAKR